MTKSLMARVGAVAAAAAIAVSGVAAVADASTATPAARAKVATALSIRNTGPVAKPNQTVALVGGRLAAVRDHSPVRGVWVFLQRKSAAGRWIAVKAERTGRFGRVAFGVRVFGRAATFRLAFRGNRNFRRAVSASDTIAPVTK